MSETTSTTSTAPAPVADNTQPLASEPKGRTGAARILTSRDAITIYALIAFLIYAAIAIPRFASPVTTGFRVAVVRCFFGGRAFLAPMTGPTGSVSRSVETATTSTPAVVLSRSTAP